MRHVSPLTDISLKNVVDSLSTVAIRDALRSAEFSAAEDGFREGLSAKSCASKLHTLGQFDAQAAVQIVENIAEMQGDNKALRLETHSLVKLWGLLPFDAKASLPDLLSVVEEQAAAHGVELDSSSKVVLESGSTVQNAMEALRSNPRMVVEKAEGTKYA